MGKFDYKQITKEVMMIYKEVLEKVKSTPDKYKQYVIQNYSKYDDLVLKEQDLIEKYSREWALLNYYFSILKSINPRLDDKLFDNEFYPLKKFKKIDIGHITSPKEIVELFLYSSKMLLEKKNKYFCEFFTPELVAQKVINHLSNKELLNLNNTFLDPSCGIGSLLTTLLIKYDKLKNSKENLANFIESRLNGFDILPFSVLSTKIQILSIFYFITKDYDRIPTTNIVLKDSLEDSSSNKFTYIIANPPYKKIKQVQKAIESYKNLIYGHPNLYSIFILWSINKLEDDGALIFLVPEMLKTGMYNQSLREKINREMHVDSVSLFPKKRNLFYDAEQRVMGIRISKNAAKNKTKITTFNKKLNSQTIFLKKGEFIRNSKIKNIWFFPNTTQMGSIIKKININSRSLESYDDFVVGNGSYVWNQRKEFLVSTNGIPLIYSNSISENGLMFPFSFKNTDKKEFSSEFYTKKIFNDELIVVKRTTGSENSKRIVSCLIDRLFLKRYNQYYLENHVNYIKGVTSRGKNLMISLNSYLNSSLVNFYFSALSANQHLSVYEINSLPLNLELMNEISKQQNEKNPVIDEVIYNFFKLTNQDTKLIEKSFSDI